MDTLLVAAPFVALLISLIIGIPIAFALGASGCLGIWLISGKWSTMMAILSMTPFATVAEYVLSTVPMFILMAYFSESSGLADQLFNAASKLLSHIKGGLAVATIFACTIFGAMSGSSVACSSVMSTIALPNMRRIGYSDTLSTGCIAVGSTLNILIPPSILLIIYGVATETSIGRLLIAGVVPGLLLAVILVISIFVWVSIRPQDAPLAQSVPWAERWKSVLPIWPSILLIFLVLALLYSGMATPTEVGALGAFLSLVIGFFAGRLRLIGVLKALINTVSTTGMIFMILIGATIFGQYMVLSRVPQSVIVFVEAMNLNRYVIIIGIVIAYFIISMFMDELPLLLITLQITFPLIKSFGFDPIWYGILSMMMVSMGLIFPPVGLLVFVVSGTSKVPLDTVYKGTSILVIAILFTTAFLIIFPQIALWLPSTMK